MCDLLQTPKLTRGKAWSPDAEDSRVFPNPVSQYYLTSVFSRVTPTSASTPNAPTLVFKVPSRHICSQAVLHLKGVIDENLLNWASREKEEFLDMAADKHFK